MTNFNETSVARRNCARGWGRGHKENISVIALGNERDSTGSCGTFATFGNGALAHAQGTIRPLPRDGRCRGKQNSDFLWSM